MTTWLYILLAISAGLNLIFFFVHHNEREKLILNRMLWKGFVIAAIIDLRQHVQQKFTGLNGQQLFIDHLHKLEMKIRQKD